MGTIKDVTDLVNQLLQKAEDRKFAGELREIQRMIGFIQSDHARLHEQNIALMSENAGLKEKVTTLELALSRRNQPASDSESRHEIEHRILVLLAKEQRPMTPIEISQALSISRIQAQHYTHALEEAEFLHSPITLDQNHEFEYSLKPKAREYLVNRNLPSD